MRLARFLFSLEKTVSALIDYEFGHAEKLYL